MGGRLGRHREIKKEVFFELRERPKFAFPLTDSSDCPFWPYRSSRSPLFSNRMKGQALTDLLASTGEFEIAKRIAWRSSLLHWSRIKTHIKSLGDLFWLRLKNRRERTSKIRGRNRLYYSQRQHDPAFLHFVGVMFQQRVRIHGADYGNGTSSWHQSTSTGSSR